MASSWLQLLAIMKLSTFQFDPKSHSKLKGNDEIRMSFGILVQLALPPGVCVERCFVFLRVMAALMYGYDHHRHHQKRQPHHQNKQQGPQAAPPQAARGG